MSTGSSSISFVRCAQHVICLRDPKLMAEVKINQDVCRRIKIFKDASRWLELEKNKVESRWFDMIGCECESRWLGT